MPESSVLPRNEGERLVVRARRQAGRGAFWEASKLYADAVEHLEGTPAAAAAEEWLEYCLQVFGAGSDQALQAAEAFARSDEAEGPDRLRFLKGLALSQEARRVQKAGGPRAIEFAQAAREQLEQIEDKTSDDWGTLGGVLSRLAEWTEGDERARFRADALEAYRAGSDPDPDPYCFLNYLVESLLLEGKLPGGEDDEAKLDRLIRVRRRQFRSGIDAPWPAFDIALARWLMKPDAVSLVEDLGVAVREAQAAAHSHEDAWMVDTALRTWKRLAGERGTHHGAGLAVTYLGHQLEEHRWFASALPRAARPEDLLTDRLAELKRTLSAQHRSTFDRISALDEAITARWSDEDERAFEEWIEENRQSWESTDRKLARLLWRIGKSAIGDKGGDLVREVGAALGLLGDSKDEG